MQIKTSEITLNTHLMAITRDKKTTELEHLHFLISELHHETGEQGGAETGSHTPSMGLQHGETAACMSLKLRSPYGATVPPLASAKRGAGARPQKDDARGVHSTLCVKEKTVRRPTACRADTMFATCVRWLHAAAAHVACSVLSERSQTLTVWLCHDAIARAVRRRRVYRQEVGQLTVARAGNRTDRSGHSLPSGRWSVLELYQGDNHTALQLNQNSFNSMLKMGRFHGRQIIPKQNCLLKKTAYHGCD